MDLREYTRSDVYSVTKVLIQDIIRNFTLMELYQAYTDYEGMMDLTENMFRYLAEKYVEQQRFLTMESRSILESHLSV